MWHQVAVFCSGYLPSLVYHLTHLYWRCHTRAGRNGDRKNKTIQLSAEEEDLGKGNLFATGLVAGGAIAGVIVAFMSASENISNGLKKVNAEHGLQAFIGTGGYKWLGVAFFAFMAFVLYRIGTSKQKNL